MVTLLTTIQRRLGKWPRQSVGYALIIAVFAFVVMGLTYQGPYLIQFVDERFPIHYRSNLSLLFYAYNPVNLGTYSGINAFNLPTTLLYLPLWALGFPPWANQFFVNTLAIFLSGLGMSLLLRRLLGVTREDGLSVSVLAGSLFYMLSIVSVEVLFWDFIPLGPVLQAVLPFQVLLLISGYEKVDFGHEFPWSSVLAVSILSPFTIGANDPLGVSPAVILTGFSIWRLVAGRKGRVLSRVILTITTFCGVLGANLYWLIPELRFISGSGESITPLTIGYSASVYDFQSYTSRLTFIDVLSLRGLQQNLFTWYAPLFSTHSPYILLLMPLLVLLIIPLLQKRSGVPVSRFGVAIACWIMLLATSWLSLGDNAPLLGSVGRSILTSQILIPIFRNTGNSFGLAIVFIEAILVSNGLLTLGAKFARKPSPPQRLPHGAHRYSWTKFRGYGTVEAVSVVIIAAVFIGPAIIPGASGSLVPTTPYHSRVVIPPFAQSLANYINTHAGTEYTLLIPGGFQEENWTGFGGHGYLGQDILSSLITTPVIVSPGGGLGGPPNQLISLAYSSVETGHASNIGYSRLLSLIGVKFVVLESGLGQHYPWGISVQDNISIMKTFLMNQSGIKFLLSYGPYYLYENLPAPIPTLITPSVAGHRFGSTVNVTQLFANSTAVIGPNVYSPPLFLLPNGSSFDISVNASEQLGGISPFPILFNEIPLNISFETFPYLTVTFTTNKYTEIMFETSDSSHLNRSNLQEALQSTWQDSTPSSNGIPSPGWYYAPSTRLSVTINLLDALSSVGASEGGLSNQWKLNYLAFLLFPTEGNAIQQAHTTQSDVHPLLATISSITVASAFYYAPNQSIEAGGPSSASLNITSAYSSSVNGNGSSLKSPLSVTARPIGFNLTWNGSQLGFPGYPIVFNDKPLGINVSRFGCLSVTFETKPGTGLAFGLSDFPTITRSTFAQSWVAVSAGNSFPTTQNGIFQSSSLSTIAIAAQSLLSEPVPIGSTQLLNYFYIQIVGIGPMVRNYSAWVANITASTYCSFAEGSVVVPTALEDSFRQAPDQQLPFNPSSDVLLPANISGPRTTFATISSVTNPTPVSWRFNLHSNGSTAYVVFLRNFDPGWKLTVSKPNIHMTHIEVDGFANGWILNSTQVLGNLNASLVYGPQQYLSTGIGLSGVLNIGMVFILVTFKRREISRRIVDVWKSVTRSMPKLTV